MSLGSKINFHLLIMSNWLAKHVSTKVSLKITTRKRHVYIEIGWTWIWNQCLYLGIWNNDRTKMIVLLSFQLITRLHSRNTNETEFINEIWHISSFMKTGNSIGIIEVSTSRTCCSWIYFSYLHDYWPPSTWISLVHTSWGEMERSEKRDYQLLKMRKKKISSNIKTKCVTDLLLDS